MINTKKLKRAVSFILAGIIITSAFSGCSGQEKEPIDFKNIQLTQEQKDDISKDIEQGLIEKGFSGTAYAGLNSQDIFLESFGYMDSKEKNKINNNQSYQLGSVTQIFTGLSIMQLEAQGKIKLTDTLDKYFDDYKYIKGITIENLLNMTSGFGSYLDDITNDKKFYKKINKKSGKKAFDNKINKDIEKYILNTGTKYKTGDYHYSNSGYFLLGRIISKFSDDGYSGYIRDNFIKPLELENTGFMNNKSKVWGFSKKSGNWRTPSFIPCLNNPAVMYSSMGMTSCAEDLNKVLNAVLNNKIAENTDTIDKITSGKTKYNYGFYISPNSIYAEGSTTLHSAYVLVDTDCLIKSVTLSNHTNIKNFEEVGKVSYNAIKSKLNGMLIDNA